MTEKDCIKLEGHFKTQDYNIVLTSKPQSTSKGTTFFYELKGKDLSTYTDTVINLYDYRWYDRFYYYWDKGDTLIKKKESLIFEIRKKDTVYYIQWDCKESLINGKPMRLVAPPK